MKEILETTWFKPPTSTCEESRNGAIRKLAWVRPGNDGQHTELGGRRKGSQGQRHPPQLTEKFAVLDIKTPPQRCSELD